MAVREMGGGQADIGDPVADFYTRHPYPPPVSNLDRARDEWQDPYRRRAEFHQLWPDRPYRADLEILVAGCGTWQAAKYAVCHQEAHVTGIDVSATSLDHTQQLQRRYGLTNLEVEQRSIEDAGGLRRRFDVVVCTGVLHHLLDPIAGLRALHSALKPDGVLYLMVYAPYGRAGVYLLQDYCRRLGVGTTARELADLTAVVGALPRHHPLAVTLAASRDAQHSDALADALLNPRDRAYAVPQLFELIEQGGLRFERWFRQAPYLPECGAFAATPHAARVGALPPRERYAALELWRGTMTAHSVILSRADVHGRPHEWTSRDDQRWAGFVPIRVPYTVCVQERLPPGAAAVLLNRSHQYADLVLPISHHERQLFDAIDGTRTIASIARLAGADVESPGTRKFFETLWRYDQVVFDSSDC